MGFIKDTVKEAWAKKSRERKERRAYQSILKKKTTAIQRQAYAEESMKLARIKAVQDAKAKYNKPKATLAKPNSKQAIGYLGGLVDNFYGNEKKRR